ncbi:adenosine deaminase [Candidatus Gottesmanbacteria bacterium]|nr:adenosine deaminase [Candidatus Gottesmanbacteria bacterium]
MLFFLKQRISLAHAKHEQKAALDVHQTKKRMFDSNFFVSLELAEIHTHLGFSVSPTMLWEIAHNQGLRLPTKNYFEFEKLVTMYESKGYEEYLMLFDLTEKIQSSPEALFLATETAVSSAYRKNNITTLELRFNPILRSRSGERDLDHLIVFAIQGMERAMLKYPVNAGLILMMDRRFTLRENEIIVEKAIKYKSRGIIGVDLAGPIHRTESSKVFRPKDILSCVREARKHELGVTVHTGETTSTDEMWEVVNNLRPDRIGHGIACVTDEKLMNILKSKRIVLETCPTSNLHTKALKNIDHMREMYKTLLQHDVPFTINTDGPEMQKISLRGEYQMLLEHNVLTKKELLTANKLAHKVSFLKKGSSI